MRKRDSWKLLGQLTMIPLREQQDYFDGYMFKKKKKTQGLIGL